MDAIPADLLEFDGMLLERAGREEHSLSKADSAGSGRR
jgi:hypothetical protein